jgi:hypothetical protein
MIREPGVLVAIIKFHARLALKEHGSVLCINNASKITLETLEVRRRAAMSDL